MFFHWHEGRDASGLDALFEKPCDTLTDEAVQGFIHIIQCDGYSAYPAWAKDKSWIKLMGCHAHMRRKFFEATEQSPRLVAWILRQIAHLYQIEARLREAKAGPSLRQAARAAESNPIHQRLHKAITLLAKRRILPKSKLGKAIYYALRQWPQFELYLTDGRVEIDNNLVENAIRPTKLGAKNWLFIGREEAGKSSAILYTILVNCQRLGIDPREYLVDVLTRLPGMPASEAAALTPAAWQAAREGKVLWKQVA